MVADQNASWQLSRIHDVDGSYQSSVSKGKDPDEWFRWEILIFMWSTVG